MFYVCFNQTTLRWRARAWFELLNYDKCVEFFKRVRKLAPYLTQVK